MLQCLIALWQDCSCGRKWNKNCSLPEQVEKYLIVDHFVTAQPFRVDFANEDSLIRSCSDDECLDSSSWDLMLVSTEIMRTWRWLCMVPTPQGQGLPWRGGKKLLSKSLAIFSQPGTWICRWMGNWRDFLQVIIAKDCFPTVQEQACIRIAQLFVRSFGLHVYFSKAHPWDRRYRARIKISN